VCVWLGVVVVVGVDVGVCARARVCVMCVRACVRFGLCVGVCGCGWVWVWCVCAHVIVCARTRLRTRSYMATRVRWRVWAVMVGGAVAVVAVVVDDVRRGVWVSGVVSGTFSDEHIDRTSRAANISPENPTRGAPRMLLNALVSKPHASTVPAAPKYGTSSSSTARHIDATVLDGAGELSIPAKRNFPFVASAAVGSASACILF
jgi:hypothetical protein